MDHPYRNIAEAFLSAELLDDASEWLDRGFDLVNNHHERGMESEFLRLQGELALATGDQKSAEECLSASRGGCPAAASQVLGIEGDDQSRRTETKSGQTA